MPKRITSVSGMTDKIRDGLNTPLSDCVPLSEAWNDYTTERDNLLQGITLDEIISSVRDIYAQKHIDENNFGEGK
jgi:hypothetical protein